MLPRFKNTTVTRPHRLQCARYPGELRCRIIAQDSDYLVIVPYHHRVSRHDGAESKSHPLVSFSLRVFRTTQVGATVGSILAFLLGRFVLRDQAQGLFNKFKVLTAVNKAIESQGLKLVILLRLSPVVPFSAFNYVM